jgi:hypothetical protein
MADHPLPIRLAQTIGITSSAFATGLVLAHSAYIIPRLLESPPPLAVKQFKAAYERGKRSVAPTAVVSALSYFYLAYHHNVEASTFSQWIARDQFKFRSYIFAAIFSIAIIPYTLIALKDVNGKLLGRADEVDVLGGEGVTEVGLKKEDTTRALLDKWGVLNLGRAASLAVATLIGTWATLN